MITLVEFIALAFATHRLTLMLYYERGPFGVLDVIRTLALRLPIANEAIECPLCLSVWCALLLFVAHVVGGDVGDALLFILAASDVSVIITTWRGELNQER